MSIFCENTNIFSQFYMCDRIKYPDEKKCINHIILLGIDSLGSSPGKGSYADLHKTPG